MHASSTSDRVRNTPVGVPEVQLGWAIDEVNGHFGRLTRSTRAVELDATSTGPSGLGAT
jgi:hypothetical protein